jgi:hypothetical protein
MKTLKLELAIDILNEFALTNEEMIKVRGGDADPISLPQCLRSKFDLIFHFCFSENRNSEI